MAKKNRGILSAHGSFPFLMVMILSGRPLS